MDKFSICFKLNTLKMHFFPIKQTSSTNKKESHIMNNNRYWYR